MTFRLKFNKKSIKYLCFDPGEKNFFYSLIENGVIKEGNQIKHSFNKITPENIKNFCIEIRELLDKHKPDFIVYERWIVRTFLAKMSETINTMLGALAMYADILNIPVIIVTAAGWKLSIKKVIDLKDLYKIAKKNHKLPPHAIDSMCLGLYAFNANKFNESDNKWIHTNLSRLVKV